MTARRLLRLYPRAWRDRYGEEFLALVGPGRLGFAQVVNIVSGAIDARVSAEVRASTVAKQGASTPQEGLAVNTYLKRLCVLDSTAAVTKRDAWIGAAVMLGVTILLAFGGAFVQRRGLPLVGEFLRNIAFPTAIIASMPFTYFKGHSAVSQAVLLGGTFAIIAIIGWLTIGV